VADSCEHDWQTLSPSTDYGVAVACKKCHESDFVFTADFCDCAKPRPFYPQSTDWSGMKCYECGGLIEGTDR
jgi:hypothetical protein